MPRIGIELPIHVDNPNLPTFPLAWIRPVGEPPLEPSDAHWLFYGSDPLTDKLAGKVLTLSDPGDATIVSGVLRLSQNWVAKWAKSDITETEPRAYTHMITADLESLRGAGVNVGLLVNLSNGGPGFAIHVTDEGKLRCTWKQNLPDGPGSFGHFCELDIPESAGKFVFIAAVETPTLTTLYLGSGGELLSHTVAHSTRALGSVDRPASLGNAYRNTATWGYVGTIDILEWAEAHAAWSEGEVQAAYDRTRLLRGPYVGRTIL